MTMPETSLPVVLLIGECSSQQFRRALLDGRLQDISDSVLSGEVNEVVAVLDSAQSHRVKSIPEAISLVAAGELIPDLVIAYQSVPDEYCSADIDCLIGVLPLSRFVIAFSPWCESIGRTEVRWPSAWSVPLGHAGARIRFELQQLATDKPPLLATTFRDEAFSALAADCLNDGEQVGLGKSARVYCADVLLKECFEAILASLHFTIDSEFPDIIVFAAAFIDRTQIQRVKELIDDAQCCERVSPQPVIVVASDMATPGDVAALKEAGATAVISQLRFAEDLVDYLRLPTFSKTPAEARKQVETSL